MNFSFKMKKTPRIFFPTHHINSYKFKYNFHSAIHNENSSIIHNHIRNNNVNTKELII